MTYNPKPISLATGVTGSLPPGNLGSQGLQTVFTTTGTFTTPANSTTATIYAYRMVGGGGGGGGANGVVAGAGGGGGAAYAEGTFTGIAASTGVTITIGAAGTAGANTGGNGGAGGNSVIGSPVSITCSAGLGGIGSTATTTASALGGAGGTVTGSPASSVPGQHGMTGFGITSVLAQGGGGANTPMGIGGPMAWTASGSIFAGFGFGSGGSGGVGSTTLGAAGAPGIVIITQLTP